MNKTLTAIALAASLIIPAVAAPSAVAAPAATSTVVSAAAKTKTLGKVTVKKIGTKKVASGKKVTVKANVKTSGKVKVTKRVITVKQGSKTLAKNKTSAKLKAGTYKVTTTVKYKVKVTKGGKSAWSKTKTKKVTQTLKVTVKKSASRYHGANTKAGQAEVLAFINKDRKSRGMAPLKRSASLDANAKQWAAGKTVTSAPELWTDEHPAFLGVWYYCTPGVWFASDLGYRSLLTDFPKVAKSAFFNKNSTHIGMATGTDSQGCPTLYITVATQK
ncbi:CAP domain-containing protein [Schaalia suimastitidis]|uniref:CAP domain-containing protein n=1 Tax=Schaalia suimastitidis TaxID=121163 RepID=UPI000428DFF9|nr:hypothetical protein [Schaalia suimastitidis]